MGVPPEAELIKVSIGEGDKHDGRPLCEVVVEESRRQGLAGVALRGTLGFGANGRIHMAKLLRLPEDSPRVVEIVDQRDEIVAFLLRLDGVIAEGVVMRNKVKAVAYWPNAQPT